MIRAIQLLLGLAAITGGAALLYLRSKSAGGLFDATIDPGSLWMVIVGLIAALFGLLMVLIGLSPRARVSKINGLYPSSSIVKPRDHASDDGFNYSFDERPRPDAPTPTDVDGADWRTGPTAAVAAGAAGAALHDRFDDSPDPELAFERPAATPEPRPTFHTPIAETPDATQDWREPAEPDAGASPDDPPLHWSSEAAEALPDDADQWEEPDAPQVDEPAYANGTDASFHTGSDASVYGSETDAWNEPGLSPAQSSSFWDEAPSPEPAHEDAAELLLETTAEEPPHAEAGFPEETYEEPAAGEEPSASHWPEPDAPDAHAAAAVDPGGSADWREPTAAEPSTAFEDPAGGEADWAEPAALDASPDTAEAWSDAPEGEQDWTHDQAEPAADSGLYEAGADASSATEETYHAEWEAPSEDAGAIHDQPHAWETAPGAESEPEPAAFAEPAEQWEDSAYAETSVTVDTPQAPDAGPNAEWSEEQAAEPFSADAYDAPSAESAEDIAPADLWAAHAEDEAATEPAADHDWPAAEEPFAEQAAQGATQEPTEEYGAGFDAAGTAAAAWEAGATPESDSAHLEQAYVEPAHDEPTGGEAETAYVEMADVEYSGDAAPAADDAFQEELPPPDEPDYEDVIEASAPSDQPEPGYFPDDPIVESFASIAGEDGFPRLQPIRDAIESNDLDEADMLLARIRRQLIAEGDENSPELAELTALAGDHAAAAGRPGGARWLWRLALQRYNEAEAGETIWAKRVEHRLEALDA